MRYSEELGITSTVDDVEGTLQRFIPPGERFLYPILLINSYFPGYYTDETSFLNFVESDAVTFKPQGQKIFSYTRPSPHSSSTKGKGKSNIQDLDPQSEDAIEFEVYYVHYLPTLPIVCYLLLSIII